MASSVRMLAASGCRGGKATHGGGPEDDWLFGSCHPFKCTFHKHLKILSHLIAFWCTSWKWNANQILTTPGTNHCLYQPTGPEYSSDTLAIFKVRAQIFWATIVAQATHGSYLWRRTWIKGQKNLVSAMRERRHQNPECNGHALRTHCAQSMRKAELEKKSKKSTFS